MHSKTKDSALKSATHNLHLVMTESSITAGLLAMSVITPFFNSIGLNQVQISETQMTYTIIALLLNLPLGYLADRVSRKWANILGDFGHAFVMLAYSQVDSFWGAVTCECIFGVCSALTDGVDLSLLEHFVGKIAGIKGTSKSHLLKTKTAHLEIAKQVCSLFLVILGGPIGAIDLRLAIALSAVNYFIGGIVSIFIKDDSTKLKPTHKNPLRDIANIIKTAFTTPMLRRRIFAFAIAREMTHGIIWIATPLFLKAGVPMSIVSFMWAGNALMAVLGAHLASKYGKHQSDPVLLAIPVAMMTTSTLIIGLSLNIITVWFYGLMGITQGWTAATMSPMVQRYTKASEQASVLSLAKMLTQLLYIPVVWIIGYAADIELAYGLLATTAIFLPLGILSIKSLQKNA